MKLQKRVWMASLGLLLAASLSVQSQEPPQPSQEPKAPEQAAVEAEQRQELQAILGTTNPEEQAARIEKFLQNYPENPQVWRLCQMASQAFRQLNNYEKAVEYGERAIALKPQDPIAHILVADSLVAEGSSPNPNQPDYEKLARAEKYARKALELLPAYFAAWKPSPSLTLEEVEVRKKLTEAEPHATLGYIHLMRRQNALAEAELLQATELAQSQPKASDFLRLGLAYYFQKKYERAVAAFRKTVAMGGPLFETAQFYLEVAEKDLAKNQSAAPAPAKSEPPTPKPPEPPTQP